MKDVTVQLPHERPPDVPPFVALMTIIAMKVSTAAPMPM